MDCIPQGNNYSNSLPQIIYREYISKCWEYKEHENHCDRISRIIESLREHRTNTTVYDSEK